MAKKFESVVTDAGKALIAAAIKGGKTINITHLAVGDGNGVPVTPHANQTALVHEVLRLDVNAIKQNGTANNQVTAQAVIPASEGGFYIREVGIFTADGTLLAVSQSPETYKPASSEGAGSTLVISMIISVADVAAISLTIDGTLVMATEAYVDDAIKAHAKSRNHPDATLAEKGLVQLSSATDSISETQAATPKAVKAAWDLANNAMPQRSFPDVLSPVWFKIVTFDGNLAGYPESRLEFELSGASYANAGVKEMSIDRVHLSLADTLNTQRITSATVGNVIRQVSSGKKINPSEFLVGVTEEVDANKKTTRYIFWLGKTVYHARTLTLNMLTQQPSYAEVTTDFSASDAQTMTEPAGIVYARREETFTTDNPPTADDMNAVKKTGDTMIGPLGTPAVVFPGAQAKDGNTDIDRQDGLCIESINGDSANYPKPVPNWLASLLTFKIGDNRNVQFAVGSGNSEFYYRSIRKDTPATMKWLRLFTTEGGTLNGSLGVDGKISLSDGLEIGNQKKPSPAYIDFHTDGTETDYNARIISPQGTTELNLIAADNANNGSGIIRMLGSKADRLSFALQGTSHDALAWRKWGSNERPTVLELDVDGGIWLMSVDHTKDNKAALGVNGVVNCEGVNIGNARMAADGNIWGTRWNANGGWLWDAIVAQVQNIGQMSVNGTQWWAKINLNGGALIVQGGFVNGQISDDGVIERVPLNISVPNRLLGVWTIIRNYAQGYETTWNPQVQDLSGARDAFSWLHGTKERMIYWIAVGY